MKKLFLLLLLPFYWTHVAAQVIPYYIPTDSLVAWYPFNANANDESGNGHNGIVDNTTYLTSDRCGKEQSAYYFNGNTSKITIPDSFFNVGWNGHTICCWFNSDTLLNPYNGNHNQCMINTKPHRGEEIGFNWGGNGKYHFWAGSSPPAAVWDMFGNNTCSQTNATIHSWNHIAIVKSGTSYSLYINGSLDNVFQTNIAALNYYCQMVIGTISEFSPETFFGKLDDYGIWKRALSDSEIYTIYSASCPVISTGITNVEDGNDFIIYPNPASDILTLRASKNLLGSAYTIADVMGRNILIGKLTNENTTIDIGKLITGVYFIQVGKQSKQLFIVAKP